MQTWRRVVPVPLKVLARRLRPPDTEQRALPPGVLVDAGKHDVIRDYARRFGSRVLVETGTYRGDTLAAVRSDFERAYSIELHDGLYRQAKWRFVFDRRIRIIHGDSAEVLERLLPKLDKPTLFWIDAHYSRGGVPSARGRFDPPLLFELTAVLGLRDPRHVILIDDARLLGAEPGYPTFAEIEQAVRESELPLEVEMADDIVRVHPA